MESYYEINVSLNGVHFFATSQRSIKTESDLNYIYNVLKDKFTKSEGFKISVTYWEGSGKILKLEGME
jgi:hypothetical protein